MGRGAVWRDAHPIAPCRTVNPAAFDALAVPAPSVLAVYHLATRTYAQAVKVPLDPHSLP
jgi:hypothetical protein